jgi:hypothetical protein
LKDDINTKQNQIDINIFPHFPVGTPRALAQILEVVCLVKKEGYSREQAVRVVADIRGIAIPTVHDKMGRQLGKNTAEIDRLLLDENLNDFKELLCRDSRFQDYSRLIEDTFLSFQK